MSAPCLAGGGLCALALAASLSAQVKPIEIDSGYHHLGDTRVETWPHATPDPEGLELKLTFVARENRAEHVLLIEHRDVDNVWPIVLNGKRIGALNKGKELKTHFYLVPPGALKDGTNELFLKSNKKSDDILIGKLRVMPQTQREYLNLKRIRVRVRDPQNRAIPAKITITDETRTKLSPVYYAAGLQRAVRDGVVYTSEGKAEFELPAGKYVVYASRGMEWGMDQKSISLATKSDEMAEVDLRIGREVDTRGYVSSDAHIHTLTFSGHGDSSVEERMVTLAGEGVELAISTDHNHQTDYRPYQEKMELTEYLTPVIGNEVTTKNGHFNAFPFDPKGKKPPHKLKDWVKVVDGIRQHGAKVVILNHPRWPQALTTAPFGKEHFELNRVSGQRASGPKFTFDAMELVNATVMPNKPLYVFIDWFALLNHGEKIMAVGTSDSHTVGDPVGQGRTYLRSSTDDPAQIDVDEACKSYREGHSSVAHGLFAEVFVDGEHSMGSKVQIKGKLFPVSLRIASAAWARPDRARVYLNGRLVAEKPIETVPGQPTDVRVEFEVRTPPNDAHLVCVATGPGVQGRFWKAKSTANYVLAATNPVFLDVDGDGKYVSPRHRALRILREQGIEPQKLVEPLKTVDDAVAVQLLGALHESYFRLAGDDEAKRKEALQIVRGLVEQFPSRPVLGKYLKSIGG